MKKKLLGNSGIEVPNLAFGGNVFGWTIDAGTSFTILDELLASGYNFIDTADVYSSWKPGNKGGESETIIGNWMKERKNREQIIIATKVGSDMGEGKTLKSDYIIKAAEASLLRLQTDYIDLYQTHFDDITTPVEETIDALNKLIKQGKVKAIGASNFSKERLEESVEYSRNKGLASYQTFQPEYNLYAREQFEKEYKNYCLEKHINVICYYSLASGFLTGKYRSENDLSKSARGGGIKKYLNPRGFKILAALDAVSEKYHVSQAAISLAWLQAQEGVVPIASATSTDQLKAILQSGKITLDAASLHLLNEASNY